MAAYEKSTRPLMEFYQKRGVLVTIAAAKTPGETFQRTMKMLNDVVAHSTNSR
jgi:adenylate kinase family enzyme